MTTTRVAAVTGVTGYVGGRLVPELLRAGFSVRGIARNPGRLRDRPWRSEIDVAEADLTDAEATRAALDGVDVVYYLVHSLSADSTFAARDRRTALTFAQAAREAGVKRIVYLGGMHPEAEPGELSLHLESRREIGDILLASGVPTAALQAAVILGSGSASFEMMRYITERLPAMIAPRWVENRIQPIAVRDVLRYLVGAADIPPDVSRTFDIGGPEVLTYRQMMHRYAKIAGLPRRTIIPVPVLTPWLSSHWVGIVTPVPSSIAKPLVGSLVHEVVAREHDIKAYVPDPPEGLTGFDRAVELALAKIEGDAVETRWSDAWRADPGQSQAGDPAWAGGSELEDVRTLDVEASPDTVFDVLQAIGGESGWYSWPLAWRVRGILDRLVGGPGLRRGRRSSSRLSLNDVVDVWRVEDVTPGEMLRLRAEMKLPGRAWLEFRLEPHGDGTRITQRALFQPKGLAGQAYWFSLVPFHPLIFSQMIEGIGEAAKVAQRSGTDDGDGVGPADAEKAVDEVVKGG
ncbi:DUF2867 domain-containing protein [Serinibacter arcticus]|uniref:DUF2867 domain-containing protein n=1 Tax=Serinibacter arcticus TaxID=1655435 RepID=A0A2U1ZT39_9MICO|nr:SDR family oxidoreductase [Serinibacter arcticus]PWD50155.1 DUF2867 domain-containing protein [Serinibacter arcticus]